MTLSAEIQVQGEGTAGALAELSRRTADVPAQRPGQVGRVEVPEPGDNIGDRDAGGQECRGIAGAFDLPYGT